MALTLTSVQQASLTVSAVDAKGNPAPVDNVVYRSSDPTIIELQEDSEDPTVAWVVAVGALGNAQVTVAADADIGEGVKALTGLLDVTVVAAEAVAISIETGVPEDQPETEPGPEPVPPTTITEPPHPEHPISPGLPYPIPHKGPTKPAGRGTKPAARKR